MTTPITNQTPVSIILPVLNEERYLEATVAAITSQDYEGELEIILALGPSRDRTNEVAARLAESNSRIKLVENPSGRTADALNKAIAQSSYPIIVRVDGHSILPQGYIREAVATLARTGAVNVGGIMAAEGISTFERAVAAAMRSKFGVGGASFHVGGVEGPADTVYLGVFLRSAINEIGGFDPRFIRAQDWELNYRLRERGGLVYFNPRLQVTYRPRPNLRSLAKQYFEYGRWRRAVSRRYPETINFRYLAPPTAVVVSFISIVGSFFKPQLVLPFVIYLLSLLIGSLFIGKSWEERFRLPLVLFTILMSWGIGFLTSPRKLARGNLST